VVSLSHLPFQLSGDSSTVPPSPWDYFYPHETHHSSSPSRDLILRQLPPSSSTNIILSINQQVLWKWFEECCLRQRKPLQETLALLLETITLFWVIRLSDSLTTKIFEDTGGSGFSRSGMVSYHPLNSQNISKALLLPLLELKFNRPPQQLSPLRPSASSKTHLSVRKFHPLSVTIDSSLPLLLSLFQHISRPQIVKIEIESILLLLSDGDDGRVGGVKGGELSGTSSHPLQAKNCIVTGNPHQLIPISLSPGSSSSPDCHSRQTVHHEISCCFTRCGGYKLYPMARLLIEYLPIVTSKSSLPETCSITSSSSWWMAQQPSLIVASPV
jgi:hypothetical protein